MPTAGIDSSFTLRDLAAVVSASVLLVGAIFTLISTYFFLKVDLKITQFRQELKNEFVSQASLPGILAIFKDHLLVQLDSDSGYMRKGEMKEVKDHADREHSSIRELIRSEIHRVRTHLSRVYNKLDMKNIAHEETDEG